MTALADLESIDPNTTADAVEVDSNFDAIQLHINNELIRRDGGVAMTNPLLLSDDPTQDNHAANKGYVDAVIPVGTIFPFGGESAPEGDWLICTGAEKSIASYPILYSVLLLRYGTPSVVGNFRLPDLRGRIPIGKFASSPEGRFDLTGNHAGSWAVPVPSHTHTINHDHGVFTSSGQSVDHDHTITSDGAHTHQGDHLTDAVVTGGGFRSVPPNTVGATAQNMTFTAGGHSHTIGDNSVDHTHQINVPALTGVASGAYEKEVVYDSTVTPNLVTTTEHIPPYVVVNYIIKADPT